MKKVNFDGLDHIKAPQEWIDRAALIPELEHKKRSLPVKYRFAAAAALVLASIVGVVVFMMFSGKPAPAIGKTPPSAQSQTETGQGATSATGSGEYDPTIIGGTSATSASEGAAAPSETRSYSSEPTTATSKPTSGSTAATSPNSSTASPTTKATEKTSPTTSSAAEPTSAPETDRPTQAPQPTETQPQIYPTVPTEAQKPTEEPTGYSSQDDGTVSVSALFSASMITDGEPIYCIVQPRGSYAGATEVKDRFSDERRAHYMIMKNGMVFAGYDAEVEQPISDGTVTYDYFFYNSKGEILARGSTTV